MLNLEETCKMNQNDETYKNEKESVALSFINEFDAINTLNRKINNKFLFIPIFLFMVVVSAIITWKYHSYYILIFFCVYTK